ncbi:MAG TPA: bifunctional glutamate N-acetyltransferase/amino-acid acetyltransferase ArgJ [Acidimicrobiales bacterium]|nr:bifunctional glutamate N-acetyltransferase/amino-acid acetyltransferase ArgJ [Acidimicrobiales bacterium]
MSVTAPVGFVAGGVACGVKASGDLDLALVASTDGRPVAAAAVFTANKAAAAPVQVSRRHLEASDGRAAAVVVNSGNANAATGAAGVAHAEQTCAVVAQGLGCRETEVLVCSTGLIGIPLAIDRITAGIPVLLQARNSEGGPTAATAMMTTDTHAKQVVVPGAGFTVGGMAKGAAMLAPNMATMLAVLTTDAATDPATLKRALAEAVARSFNQMTVDGCTSTNDTVIVLASGRAAPPAAPGEAELTDALWEACADLAGQMAADAEGGTRVVRVRVTGAASSADAAAGARKIAQSPLVKCSFYGQDPYWGRVVSELGSAGIEFDLDRVEISYGGITVCRGGVAAGDPGRSADLKKVMAADTVEVVARLGLGDGEAAMITCDLGHGYIDENMGTS